MIEVTVSVFHPRERPVPKGEWVLVYVGGYWRRGFCDGDKFHIAATAWWPLNQVEAWAKMLPDVDKLRGAGGSNAME